jgi:hypothetical protein
MRTTFVLNTTNPWLEFNSRTNSVRYKCVHCNTWSGWQHIPEETRGKNLCCSCLETTYYVVRTPKVEGTKSSSTINATLKIELSFDEAQIIMHALDTARDAIQPITIAQIKLHHLHPNTDQLLERSMDILGPKLGMKKEKVD